MLRPSLLVLALSCAVSCTGYAQQPATPKAQPSAASSIAKSADTAKPASATATSVPLTEPVITLKGACPAPKAGKTAHKDCVSALTRGQFEQLTNALQPPEKGPVPPEIKRRFAAQYAKLLTFADAARELGLENDPKVLQIERFMHNQVLAETLNQHYMEKFAHPSQQQIQQYYDQHKKDYMEVTLQRIVIPVEQEAPDKKRPTPEEQKTFAEQIRSRWVAGEDPAKLEKEAMDHTDLKSPPPDVNVGARRPGSIPEAHEGVFSLKPGEVSPLFSDPAAFYIYKVVSGRQIPLTEVKTQIEQIVQRDEYTKKIDEIQKSVTPVLNDAYFGPEPAPGMPGMPAGVMHPGMPPHGPGAPPPGNPGAAPAPKAPAQAPAAQPQGISSPK